MLIPWESRLAQAVARPLRVIFFGTPDIAIPALDACNAYSTCEVCAVVSRPDRPAGRGRKAVSPPLVGRARELNIPVMQPEKLASIRAELESIAPDLLVVIAYGKILSRWLLQLPKIGPLNLHASLLPEYRGAAPIQAVILSGETHSGMTLMGMEPEMDAGPVLLQRSLALAADETAGSLHDRLALLAAQVISDGLDALERGTLTMEPQNESQATYTSKISPESAVIDWSQPSIQVDRHVRAFTPFPGPHTWQDELRIKIAAGNLLSDQQIPGDPGRILAMTDAGIDVACGTGTYRITRLQIPGRRVMDVADYLRGKHPLKAGQRFA